VVPRDFIILHHTINYCGNRAKTRPRSKTANIHLHVLSMTHRDSTRYFRKKKTAARTSRPITGILIQFLKSHIIPDVKNLRKQTYLTVTGYSFMLSVSFDPSVATLNG